MFNFEVSIRIFKTAILFTWKLIEFSFADILFSVSLDLELGNTWKNTKMVEFQLIFPDHFTVAMLQVRFFHLIVLSTSYLVMYSTKFIFIYVTFSTIFVAGRNRKPKGKKDFSCSDRLFAANVGGVCNFNSF